MTGDPGKPFLVIADRFGAFYSRLELDEGEEIDHEEIQSTIMFIETQCPECGAPQGDTMP